MIRVDSSEQQADAPHPLAMLSRAASGHIAVPPRSVMNSCRFTARCLLCFRSQA